MQVYVKKTCPIAAQTIIFKVHWSTQTEKMCTAVTPMKKLCSQGQQLADIPVNPCTSPHWSYIIPTCLLVTAKFWSTFSTSASLCLTSKAWSKVLALILGQAKLLSTWEKQQCNSCLILSNSSSDSERGKLRSCLLKNKTKTIAFHCSVI